MLRRFSINFAVFSMIVDGLIVLGSLIAMSYFRVILNALPFIADIPPGTRYPLALYILFPLFWVVVYASFSIYNGKKLFKIADELTSLTFASLVASMSLAGIIYLTYRDFSRALFLLIITLNFLLCLIWRLVARVTFRVRKETLNTTHRLLITGTETEVKRINKLLEKKPEASFSYKEQFFLKNISDFITDSVEKDSPFVSSLRKAIKKNKITDVLIAFPRHASKWIDWISSQLEDLPISVLVVLDFKDLALSEARVEYLAGLPLLDLRSPALDDYSRMVKRVFDILVSSIILFIAFPVMLLCAVLILIFDGWPVFFIQDRVGENGRLFKIIKFRTMVRNAEALQNQVEERNEHGEIIHKTRHDPRVTRLGRILRKLSIDELPQLFNVLKGDMSMVGPRPELPYLAEGYKHWQRQRLSVPPGITGWWQVHGRSDRIMHLHTEDDIYYVENYSIGLDVRILIRTVWVVLFGKGSF